jgi:hypothetical protein
MTAGKLEVLLVSGFDVDRSVEAFLINIYVNIKDDDMGWRDGPGKPGRIVTIVALKETEKEL